MKYYHPLKNGRKTKAIRPFFRVCLFFARIFTKKPKFIWKLPLDGQNTTAPPVFICNHTGLSAPFNFLVHYPDKIRTWSYYKFLHLKEIWPQMKNVVLKRWKANPFLYAFIFLVTPIIFWLFRSIEPIPVYRIDRKVIATFHKSVETYLDGTAQVIFAERLHDNLEQISPYVYSLNRGFVHSAKLLYQKTGEIMKFYPCYSCASLNVVLIGEPISYNPNIPLKEQRETICTYLEQKITALGASLPPHKIAKSIR